MPYLRGCLVSEVAHIRTPLIYYFKAEIFLQFLKGDINKAFAEVKSKTINRGAGFGLEISYNGFLYT